MSLVTFEMQTALPPKQVMAMLTDFSASRPELWPTLARELYEIYEVRPTSADVKQRSARGVEPKRGSGSSQDRDRHDRSFSWGDSPANGFSPCLRPRASAAIDL